MEHNDVASNGEESGGDDDVDADSITRATGLNLL